jgi:hypothetical protein
MSGQHGDLLPHPREDRRRMELTTTCYGISIRVPWPQAALALTGNAEIEPVARSAGECLERVLNRLADNVE